MFGKNIILKVVNDERGALDVHSIFTTIQGEGPFAGYASVFIRLHGCSLACSWCDTEFESQKKRYEPADLWAQVQSAIKVEQFYKEPLIVITGGEPMRQNLVPFLRYACNLGAQVQIETAGIHWDPAYERLLDSEPVHIIISPKTSKVRPELAAQAAAFKYIIDANEEFSPDDGLPLWAVSQAGNKPTAKLWRPKDYALSGPEKIFVQPLEPEVKNSAQHWNNMVRCSDLVQRYGYRLSLQQHKILDLE